MNRDIFIASLGFGALTLAAGHAFAQTNQNCGIRSQVIERLASAYGETRQSVGLGANNQVVEVFASPETGTWTITVTNANGMTCLVAAGQAFEAVTEIPAPAGDPA